MILRVILVVLVIHFHEASSFDSSNVVFVILSQPEPYHASVAVRLKEDIQNQIYDIEQRKPKVHLTHKDLKHPGSWTVIPLLKPLASLYRGGDVRWVVFVEAHTAVRCQKLIKALGDADKDRQKKWIGYPLRDLAPIIIHHFKTAEMMGDDDGFSYPYFASGFAMRFELIESVLKHIQKEQGLSASSIRIDPAFELALLLKEHGESTLSPDVHFCVVSGDNCATYPRQYDICGSPIREETIYFAVKTWSGNHATRVPVVKKTWGKHVTNLAFYSDQYDPTIPTIKTGVPNSEKGHCRSTVTTLKLAVEAVKHLPHVMWIFLTDDDTILGVHRLCEVLSCYRGGKKLTVLGERYGYWPMDAGPYTEGYGYDYITGGAGMALSIRAAQVMSRCACAQDSHPDDMTLGACALAQGLDLTHLPLFHQASPEQYPRVPLARDHPVSFHSAPDAAKVYAAWFEHDDLNVRRRKDEL